MKYWRWLGLLLLILLVALQVKFWVGDYSLRSIHQLRQSVNEQKFRNDEMRQRNDALAAEVDDLKHGDEAVEARARRNLGLIKKGEVFYQVIDPAMSSSSAVPDSDDD